MSKKEEISDRCLRCNSIDIIVEKHQSIVYEQYTGNNSDLLRPVWGVKFVPVCQNCGFWLEYLLDD